MLTSPFSLLRCIGRPYRIVDEIEEASAMPLWPARLVEVRTSQPLTGPDKSSPWTQIEVECAYEDCAVMSVAWPQKAVKGLGSPGSRESADP
jgi:hypothetical protein